MRVTAGATGPDRLATRRCCDRAAYGDLRALPQDDAGRSLPGRLAPELAKLAELAAPRRRIAAHATATPSTRLTRGLYRMRTKRSFSMRFAGGQRGGRRPQPMRPQVNFVHSPSRSGASRCRPPAALVGAGEDPIEPAGQRFSGPPMPPRFSMSSRPALPAST